MSGILGIENRTENWKTTVYFSQMFGGKSHRLAEILGATPELPPGEVKLELFWKGGKRLSLPGRPFKTGTRSASSEVV